MCKQQVITSRHVCVHDTQASLLYSPSGNTANESGLPLTPCIYQSRHDSHLKVDQDLDGLMFQMQDTQPRSGFFLETTQAVTGITPANRATVVDAMIVAAYSLGLHSDSTFMGVQLYDAYLALQPTPLSILQPLSIACLWIGAKYEQLVTPAAACFADYVVMPEDAPCMDLNAARELLLLLEGCVLRALDYKLAAFVTAKAFVRRIMQLVAGLMQDKAAAGSSCSRIEQQQLEQEQQQYSRLYFMTSYLAEVCLLEYNMLAYQPSQLAAAAFGFAHVLLGMQLDEQLFKQITCHALSELRAPMQWLCALHTTLAAAQALGRPYGMSVKYNRPELLAAAGVPPVLSTSDPRLSTAAAGLLRAL